MCPLSTFPRCAAVTTSPRNKRPGVPTIAVDNSNSKYSTAAKGFPKLMTQHTTMFLLSCGDIVPVVRENSSVFHFSKLHDFSTLRSKSGAGKKSYIHGMYRPSRSGIWFRTVGDHSAVENRTQPHTAVSWIIAITQLRPWLRGLWMMQSLLHLSFLSPGGSRLGRVLLPLNKRADPSDTAHPMECHTKSEKQPRRYCSVIPQLPLVNSIGHSREWLYTSPKPGPMQATVEKPLSGPLFSMAKGHSRE